MRDREGYAVAVDGTPLYFRLSEPTTPSGLAVVLCDGIGCNGFVWKYLRPRLVDAGVRVVHAHYRGHGKTPPPRDRRHLSVVDLADDVAAVLDATDTPRAALLGHSMGVQVCLEVYRRHGARVIGLGLLCGSYGHPLRTFHGRRTLESVLPWVSFLVARTPRLTGTILQRTLPTRFAYEIARRMELNPELSRLDDFMPYLEHLGDLDPTLFLGMLALAGRHSARDLLPEIRVPTMIVAGGLDGFTPAILSQEMHELVRGSTLVRIDDGSHTAPLERPDRVGAAVDDWLAEIAAR